MFGSQMLGTATGLVLVYIVLSLIVTSAKETVEAVLKTRSKDLERGIEEIFRSAGGKAGPNLQAFYDQPLISALYRGSSYAAAKSANDLPAYIPAKNFSAAVLSMYHVSNATALDVPSIRTAASQGDSAVAKAVVQAIDLGAKELEQLRTELESWYDSVMDRVAGWYKRRSQIMLFLNGLVIAIALNANSIIIAQSLYVDDALRSRVDALASEVHDASAKAQAAAAAPTATLPARATSISVTDCSGAHPDATVSPSDFNACVSDLDQRLRSTGLPVGWTELGRTRARSYVLCSADKCEPLRSEQQLLRFAAGLLLLLFGYLGTAAALALGAPFWFDVLNKIMVVRSTVKPQEKSADEGSKDAR